MNVYVKTPSVKDGFLIEFPCEEWLHPLVICGATPITVHLKNHRLYLYVQCENPKWKMNKNQHVVTYEPSFVHDVLRSYRLYAAEKRIPFLRKHRSTGIQNSILSRDVSNWTLVCRVTRLHAEPTRPVARSLARSFDHSRARESCDSDILFFDFQSLSNHCGSVGFWFSFQYLCFKLSPSLSLSSPLRELTNSCVNIRIRIWAMSDSMNRLLVRMSESGNSVNQSNLRDWWMTC